jgi:uncharacterized membrane protein
MIIGACLGVVSAFLQTLEKLTLLQDKNADLACNINSVFSCSNVLNAWQSSLLGFPNSILCMTLFTIFAAIALAGVSGGMLPKRLRLGIQALTLFTLGFALWFIATSTFVIGALCIFCLFCLTGLLLVNGAWLRINAADLPIGSRGRAGLRRLIASGGDICLWIVLALGVAFMIALRFY